MRDPIRVSAALIIFGMLTQSLQAQSEMQTDGDEDRAEIAFDRSISLVATEGPLDREGVGGAGVSGSPEGGRFAPPAVEFSTDTENSVASLSLSYEIGDTTPEANGFDVTTNRFSLRASAPVSKGGDGTSVFGFTSPGNGQSLSLAFTRYSTSLATGQGARAPLDAAFMNCLTQSSANWLQDTGRNDEPSAFRERLAQQTEFLRRARIEIFEEGGGPNTVPIERNNQLQKALYDHSIANCDPSVSTRFNTTNEFVERYAGPNAADAFRGSFAPRRDIFFWGGSVTLGRHSFSYLDLPSFSILNQNRTSHELSAFAGLIHRQGQWSLRGRLSRARRFKEQSAGEFCQPVDGGPLERCLSGPIGEPTEINSLLLSGELRVRLSDNVAIAPQVTYDMDEDEFAIDVPIFLARANASSPLNGGIRFGYRSDKDEFGVGLFVGTTFDIFR